MLGRGGEAVARVAEGDFACADRSRLLGTTARVSQGGAVVAEELCLVGVVAEQCGAGGGLAPCLERW